MISAMGEKIDAILRPGFIGFRLLEHAKNLRKSTVPPVRYVYLRFDSYVSIHRRNDRQDAHTRNIKGKVTFFIEEESKYPSILIFEVSKYRIF